MDSSLARENRVVLDVVQAALGLISREIRAISVLTEPGRVILHIAFHAWTEQVQEDVDDLVFGLLALQETLVKVEAPIHVGELDLTWPGIDGRRIYVARETELGPQPEYATYPRIAP